MKTALIGYTGFVGKNLDAQYEFTHKYNSKNIENIKGQEYDIVICCGISASMWMANNNPDKDLSNIQDLLDILTTVNAKKFILISTIAVFNQDLQAANEDCLEFEDKLSYGRNRRYAEEEIVKYFKDSYILRLPALFGKGLKKNFIFDLLNQEPAFIADSKFQEICNNLTLQDQETLKKYYIFDDGNKVFQFNTKDAIANNDRPKVLNILKKTSFTALNFTNSNSIFQFYYLDDLFTDITIALNNKLHLLHLCCDPIKAKEIAREFFNLNFDNNNGQSPINQNFSTLHSKYWNKDGLYQYSKQDVMSNLRKFIKSESS